MAAITDLHAGRPNMLVQRISRVVDAASRAAPGASRPASGSIAATRHTRCVYLHHRALEHGAYLEDVQKAAGHRDSGATKLYDRRGYNPEGAAFFATC